MYVQSSRREILSDSYIYTPNLDCIYSLFRMIRHQNDFWLVLDNRKCVITVQIWFRVTRSRKKVLELHVKPQVPDNDVLNFQPDRKTTAVKFIAARENGVYRHHGE